MAESREGNVLVTPGYTQKATVIPVELIAAYGRGLFQKGVTLAGNKGVLRPGLALKQTDDIYSGANTSESSSVVGFLRDAVDCTSTTEIHEGNIVFGGTINAAVIHYADTVQDARTVADAVFNSTTTVTSATAAFTVEDIGRTISGAGITAGTTITARGSATSITISQATSTSGTGKTITIGPNTAGLNSATLGTLATAMKAKVTRTMFKF